MSHYFKILNNILYVTDYYFYYVSIILGHIEKKLCDLDELLIHIYIYIYDMIFFFLLQMVSYSNSLAQENR